MAEQNLVEGFERRILGYLDGAQSEQGWGGSGDMARLFWSLGRERNDFVQAMENLLRRDGVAEAVKVELLDLAATESLWELEDVVNELDAQVPTDLSERVPGVLPRNMTVRLRLFINQFFLFYRAAVRERA